MFQLLTHTQERRLRQESIARDLDKDMMERITAAKLLQGHIADLLPAVLNSMEPYLEAENREELEKTLGPWLAQEVAEEVGNMIDSQELLEEIVREILEDRAARYFRVAEAECRDDDSFDEEEAGHEGEVEDEYEDEEIGEN